MISPEMGIEALAKDYQRLRIWRVGHNPDKGYSERQYKNG